MLKKPEPVMIASIAALLVGFAARHGVTVPVDLAGEVVTALFVVIAGLWARSRVTPGPTKARKVPTIPGLLMLLAVLPLAHGCTKDRSICYGRANVVWALEAEKACPVDDDPLTDDWDGCPHRQRIVDGHKTAMEACP